MHESHKLNADSSIICTIDWQLFIYIQISLTFVAPWRVNFQDPDSGLAVITRYLSTAMVESVTIDTKPNWPTPKA